MNGPTFETFDEEWARCIVGVIPTRGIDGFLGIVVTEVAPGRLVAEMPATEIGRASCRERVCVPV